LLNSLGNSSSVIHVIPLSPELLCIQDKHALQFAACGSFIGIPGTRQPLERASAAVPGSNEPRRGNAALAARRRKGGGRGGREKQTQF